MQCITDYRTIGKQFEEIPVCRGSDEIKLTASFFVAANNTDIDRLLKDADKALYKTKAEGRNCVRQAF